MTDFQITHKDGNARRGKLNTKNGIINTPAFMPVGTAATVKAIFTKDLPTLLVKALKEDESISINFFSGSGKFFVNSILRASFSFFSSIHNHN